MNIKKSINVACAQRGLARKQLAEMMEVSVPRIHALSNQRTISVDNITKLAGVFNLTVSEFIALGE